MLKFLTEYLAVLEPYLETIHDEMIHDVAKVLIPIAFLMFVFVLVSLPFGLATELVKAFVSVSVASMK